MVAWLSDYPIAGLAQVPEELDKMVALYTERKPKRVLEIGIWYGGTLRKWLEGEPEVVVAVDPEPWLPEDMLDWAEPGTELLIIEGFSQQRSTIDTIRKHAPYDWVFLDGDHEYDAIRADAELALSVTRPGGLILLHDIETGEHHHDGPYGPERVFTELAEKHRNWTIVEDPAPSGYPETSAHGIGILEV